jgi:hypothetical protein
MEHWLPRSLHSEPQRTRLSGPFGFAQGRRDDGERIGEEKAPESLPSSGQAEGGRYKGSFFN